MLYHQASLCMGLILAIPFVYYLYFSIFFILGCISTVPSKHTQPCFPLQAHPIIPPSPPCSANYLCISLYDFLICLHLLFVCAKAYFNPHHSLLYIHTFPFLSCCILIFHSFVLIYLFFKKDHHHKSSFAISTIWNSLKW